MKPMRAMRERVSELEWDLRVNLAACYRLVAKYGMTDLIYNHITARVPGPEHHILISAYGMLYEEVTASSLIKVDSRATSSRNPITTIRSTPRATSSTARCTRRALTRSA